MKQSIISEVLKTGSLVLCGFGIVGSIPLSNEMQYIPAKYSFSEATYESVFSPGKFCTYAFSIVLICTLIYAFGELIEHTYNNSQYLHKLINLKEKELEPQFPTTPEKKESDINENRSKEAKSEKIIESQDNSKGRLNELCFPDTGRKVWGG